MKFREYSIMLLQPDTQFECGDKNCNRDGSAKDLMEFDQKLEN